MTAKPVKAITIRQPWATAIFRHGKDVENRTWNTKFRGKIYIHAGKTIDEHWRIRRNHKGNKMFHTLDSKALTIAGAWTNTGVIIGSVEIVDVTEWSRRSRWFIGPYGFILKDPTLLPTPIPCRGMPGIFTLDHDVVKQLPIEDWYKSPEER